MKKFLLFVFALLPFVPAVALAQDAGAGPATFANSPTLWIAIIIGLIASAITLRYAFQMKGSTVGKILQLLGWGMFFVVLGFLSVAVMWAPENTQKIVHDLLFIAGYVSILFGAIKIRKLSV